MKTLLAIKISKGRPAEHLIGGLDELALALLRKGELRAAQDCAKLIGDLRGKSVRVGTTKDVDGDVQSLFEEDGWYVREL
jgi:hypothetical protein